MKLSHLAVEKTSVAPFVILPGDPSRVDRIGTFLDDFTILASTREFRVGNGSYKGQPVTVCSTGIGCPSTAIAVEELISAGARTLIRVGTCGGAWRSDIPLGSLIIPTASIRDEGTTLEYIPLGFPAVADPDVVNALAESARARQYPARVGINRTHDAFYGSRASITKWGEYLKDERWKNADTPILSSEMESAALFVIASLRGVKAGAVFAANADPEPLKKRVEGNDIPVVTEDDARTSEKTIDKAIQVALDALSQFSFTSPQ